MKTKLVVSDYEGIAVAFTEDAWFNATLIAAKFDKEPHGWLTQRDTIEYLAALSSADGNSGFVQELNKIKELDSTSSASRVKGLALAKKTGFVKTKAGSPETGGGTWLHPQLAVFFARWLDVNFAVWCDRQINQIITSKHPHFDWKRARHEASATHKVAMSILQAVRTDEGKDTKQHHYSNEARLINWALTGEFKSVDRENLTYEELDLLAKIEEKDAVLVGKGRSYAERKLILEEYASELRTVKDRPRLIKEAEALYSISQ